MKMLLLTQVASHIFVWGMRGGGDGLNVMGITPIKYSDKDY